MNARGPFRGDDALNKNYAAFCCCVLVCLCLFSGCTETEEKQIYELSDELNVFNWEWYFAPDTIENFENRFGVKVNLYTFDEEDFMLSSLESNQGKYDVVVATFSLIKDLIAKKVVAEIDVENIPNINNVYSNLLSLCNCSEGRYSVPYLWGTTGIAVNTSKVSENISSWSALWDEQYNGSICLLFNKREVISAGLKYFGYSINTNNVSKLNEVWGLLLRQKPMVQGYFDPSTIMGMLRRGEVAIAQLYSGDALYVAEDYPDITYLIPDEGAVLWIDNFFIPKDSPHKYTAEVFINYILEPDVGAEITNYLKYASANQASEPYINANIIDNPAIYPTDKILENCEYFGEVTSETYSIYNQIWEELLS